MLEAFVEVLPQSIVQLIAMVSYQATNLISVISMLLSMTSLISKTLKIRWILSGYLVYFVGYVFVLIFLVYFSLYHLFFHQMTVLTI